MYEPHTKFPTQHWIIGFLLFMMQHIPTSSRRSGSSEKDQTDPIVYKKNEIELLGDIGGPRGLIITLQALSLSRMFTLPKQNMTHIDIELHFTKLDGDIIYFDRRQKRGDIDIIVVHFLFCKVIVTWEKLGSCWGSVSLEKKYILSNTILFIYIFLWSREKIHIFFLSAYCRLI